MPPAFPERNKTTTITGSSAFTCISLPPAIATWSAARHLKMKTQCAHRSTRFSLARFRAESRGHRGSCQRKTQRRPTKLLRRRFVEVEVPALAYPKVPSRVVPFLNLLNRESPYETRKKVRRSSSNPVHNVLRHLPLIQAVRLKTVRQ